VNNDLLTDETSKFVGKEVFYLALKRKKKWANGRVNDKQYSKLTLDQALDLVIAGKRVEGLRERSLRLNNGLAFEQARPSH
jgi:hypothetical protein